VFPRLVCFKVSDTLSVLQDKEITLEKKQARNAQEIRANRQRPMSEEQLTGRKKAKLEVQQSKTVLNEKIHALFLNRRLFSVTASSEVTAAQASEIKLLSCHVLE
jgi:hypothetical protein